MLPYILIIVLTGLTDLVIALVGERLHWRFWHRTFPLAMGVSVVIGVMMLALHVT